MATFTSGAGPYTLILNANEVGGSADVEVLLPTDRKSVV